jgi:hypothetical protein
MLPNLNVMRVEYGSNPVDVGSLGTRRTHSGYPDVGSGKSTLHPVMASRFDNNKPGTTSFLNMRKPDIQAYVQAIEPFATSKLPWVSLYAGEDVGEGVSRQE